MYIKQNTRTFQFTTSQGGRQDYSQYSDYKKYTFNSRPHKEVDRSDQVCLDLIQAFNSRPHKEVDAFCNTFIAENIHLSIHDLTRRSTKGRNALREYYILSIHDLTRRSTKKCISGKWRK